MALCPYAVASFLLLIMLLVIHTQSLCIATHASLVFHAYSYSSYISCIACSSCHGCRSSIGFSYFVVVVRDMYIRYVKNSSPMQLAINI